MVIHHRLWRIFVRDARVLHGIGVAFARSHTNLIGAVLAESKNNFQYNLTTRPGLVLGEFIEGVDDNAILFLRVSYTGDAPRAIALCWAVNAPLVATEPDVLVPIWPPINSRLVCKDHWNDQLRRFTVFSSIGSLADLTAFAATYTIDPLPLFNERRQAIADHLAAQQFFLHLDMTTSPSLVSVEWTSMLAGLSYHLQTRLDVRRMLGSAGEVPLFDPIEADDIFEERATLERVSLHLRTLIVSHLSDGGERDLVDWAFELFATDLLQVTHHDHVVHGFLQSHGSPNGVFFFQFGELAFHCIDNLVDADFWWQHLTTFVRTAHVFAEHGIEQYLAAGYPYEDEQYAFAPGRFYSRDRLQELRDEYSTQLSARPTRQAQRDFLADRFTSIVSQALVVPSGSAVTPSRLLVSPASLIAGGGPITIP